ncbi:uncharacterized protein LOC123549377 isoform X1 [Mercenaria mercenaria]|uniref:uncharacterized protein LOC123549377 isoform X1 n=1 Tax=Mercenaria mercenaria TaxID=6596 RepID=UPI00234F2CE9|nr:uncharacterized protein LOC123549377 isoform X1 [Mercenaria mercenaria]
MRKNRKSQETVQNRTQPRVVYTATTTSTGIISPPAYDSGQSDQIRMNGENPFHPEPYHSASPSSLPPLNVAAGQDPAYPPNWTMPSYQQNVFRNPPPYEEMQTNMPENNDSTEREHENTDNDILENITNIASSGETDNKTVEEPTDNISVMEPPGGQVREITTNSEETEESPGNSEHEDNTLHETSHVADELASDEEDNKDKNDIIGSGNSLWEGHDKDTKVEGDNYNSKCSKLEMKNNDKTDTFEDAETESTMNIATERNSTP